MRKSLLKTYILLLVTLFVAGCEVKIPEYVIEPDRMETILYDYHLAQAISSSLGGASDYQTKLYCENVFSKHGITKEEFDTSMVYYTRYPGKMKPIYENLSKRMESEVGELQALVDKSSGELNLEASDFIGDTVNLWQARGVNLLASNVMLNKIEFVYSSEGLFNAGDSVSLNFGVHFMKPDTADYAQIAHAAILYEYSDSTMRSVGRAIGRDGFYSLAVESDTAKTIKEVRGFIYYNDKDTLFRCRMLISNLKVERIREPQDTLDASAEKVEEDKPKMMRPVNSYAAPKKPE